MAKLELEFDALMESIYTRAKKEAKYNATAFFGMLNRLRGVQTAKQLINSKDRSEGYANLYLVGRLDLTVEATLWENKKFWPLFSESDIEAARRRLEENDYFKSRPGSTPGP